MNNKEKCSIGMQWIVPIAFLIIIIIAVLINFTITGQRVSREKVEAIIENQVETYSSQLYNELETMTNAGMPISNLLSSYSKDDMLLAMNLEKSLCDSSLAYLVVFSNMKGEGLVQDGSQVKIAGESYFNPGITEQEYSYTAKECIDGESAIVSAIPLYKGDDVKGILYMYYPAERFAKLFNGTFYIEDTFYMLVLDDGEIAQKAGYHSNFVQNDNLYELLFSGDIQDEKMQRAWNRIKQSKKGSIVVENEKDEKCLVYAPLKINDWYVFMGVNNESIAKLIKKDGRDMGLIVKQLMFTIGAFLIYIFVVFMLNRVKYVENSKKLEEKADTDLLMELYNKITTEREIRKYIEANPNKQALFFLIDIDNFKKINDTMGHAFGDEVLRTIGMRLRVEFRKTDICGRIGGDEMLIFLKDISDEDAVKMEANRVAAIYKNFKVGEYVKYVVTASIGVAVYSKDGKDFETLYKAADKALYVSKKNGKNQMTFFGNEL